MKIRTLFEHLGLARPAPPRPVIRFASVIGNFSISKATAVREAKDLALRPEWIKTQLASGARPLASCPGMWDYYQCGFVIPAHCDIHVSADSEGVQIALNGVQRMDAADQAKLAPGKFDYDMVAGHAPIQDGVPKSVERLPLPWGVFLEPGWSAYVLPATMHLGAGLLDKLHIYAGVVDYDQVASCNLIFSVLKPGQFTLYAGTPLLHVIPFRREPVEASCGRATQEEMDRFLYSYPSRRKGFYRSFLHQKKSFSMGCPLHAGRAAPDAE